MAAWLASNAVARKRLGRGKQNERDTTDDTPPARKHREQPVIDCGVHENLQLSVADAASLRQAEDS
jgi:hypothetical protein